MSPRRAEVLIGTSGWNYPHWKKAVYPADLPPSHWLSWYTDRLPTVEINATFYRLPSTQAVRRWVDQTPRRFQFAIKASRFLTHINRLRDPDEPLARMKEVLSPLGSKAAVLLFQLPPSMAMDLNRLEKLARAIEDSEWKIRACLEVRHTTWLTAETFSLLSSAGIGLCFADWPSCPVEGPVTADFVYLRRHGLGTIYGGRYGPEELNRDADRIKDWLAKGKDVFAFFNNDAGGHAFYNALELKDLVSGRD